MNTRHVKLILDGCSQRTGYSEFENVKIIGENGNAAHVNACVLSFVVPWLSQVLKERVI